MRSQLKTSALPLCSFSLLIACSSAPRPEASTTAATPRAEAPQSEHSAREPPGSRSESPGESSRDKKEPPPESSELQTPQPPSLYRRGAEEIRSKVLSLAGASEAIFVERPANRTRSQTDPSRVRNEVSEALVDGSVLQVAESADDSPWLLKTTIDSESVGSGGVWTETRIVSMKLIEAASRKVLAEARVSSTR